MYKKLFFVLVLILSIAACRFIADLVPAVLPAGSQAGETSTAEQQTQLTATQQSIETEQAQSTSDAVETADAQAAADAAATSTQKALSAAATSTQAIASQLTSTAETVRKATEIAAPLAGWVQMLVERGEISTSGGAFNPADDLDESVAKINYFNWWETGFSAENFAIMADIEWDVASDKANWFNTGCGFVFAEEDEDFFHFMKLSLDGMATLRSYKQGSWIDISQKKFGSPSLPSGNLQAAMAVKDERVVLYVDGVSVMNAYAPLVQRGNISLSLSSGINTGFGTRCIFTNVGVWLYDD